jgi:hypothetical protein
MHTYRLSLNFKGDTAKLIHAIEWNCAQRERWHPRANRNRSKCHTGSARWHLDEMPSGYGRNIYIKTKKKCWSICEVAHRTRNRNGWWDEGENEEVNRDSVWPYGVTYLWGLWGYSMDIFNGYLWGRRWRSPLQHVAAVFGHTTAPYGRHLTTVANWPLMLIANLTTDTTCSR